MNRAKSSNFVEDDDFRQTSVILLVVASCVIACGNGLVLIAISRFTYKTYTLNPFIASLSLGDILHLGPAAVALYVYVTHENQGFNDLITLCNVQAWLMVFLRMVASFSVLLIGVDRTLSLSTPKFYHFRWRGRLLYSLVLAIWIIAAFLASWPLFAGNGAITEFKDAPRIYCLFNPYGEFALFFALFNTVLVLISAVFIWSILSSSRRTLFSARFSNSSGRVLIEKRCNLAHEQCSRMMSGMAAAVIGLYCLCLAPLTVAIFLNLFNIFYPHLLGLISLQAPLVSGLLNPLLYGIMWPPFRRTYIRVLQLPMACCRSCRGSQNYTSHNFQDVNLSQNPSFWSASGLPDDDGENPFNILFGPSFYNKPLGFQADELQMFENQGAENIAELDVNNSNTNHNYNQPSTEGVVMENSAQFQSILDLIEKMTDGRTKTNWTLERNTKKRERTKSIDSKSSSAYWSADKSSTHASKMADTEDVRFSFEGGVAGVSGQEGWDRVESGTPGCACVSNKSKCYVVHDGKRYLDYLVDKEVLGLGDGAVFGDI
ncbi:predicted protein [Nematostella vectensis]|uniref:G-protein coupled receptors family 1 profile domain-containing protein n=1 Tax=Nematostella vectensis TaxID=45351 RepID=A7SMD8_NEMVE|nr:adenosine receptor A3 isoform X1 [Nematostella vectensis]EDO35093.1 predicted protein [Nematostella vectensis]|eukprot:XP_001627193.1 predicted protein [Nematostella vectensis]